MNESVTAEAGPKKPCGNQAMTHFVGVVRPLFLLLAFSTHAWPQLETATEFSRPLVKSVTEDATAGGAIRPLKKKEGRSTLDRLLCISRAESPTRPTSDRLGLQNLKEAGVMDSFSGTTEEITQYAPCQGTWVTYVAYSQEFQTEIFGLPIQGELVAGKPKTPEPGGGSLLGLGLTLLALVRRYFPRSG